MNHTLKADVHLLLKEIKYILRVVWVILPVLMEPPER